MKAFLALFAVFVFSVTVGLSVYLGPDDISGCEAPELSGRCKVADAIVVVSGGDTLARVDEAIRLYDEGWSELLILSGAARDKTGPSNASAMRTHAVASGVPENSIIIEESSTTTAENAANTVVLVRQLQVKRVILVTSAYHQRRASMEFMTAYGSDITVINHPVASDNQWSKWWWATPYGWWLAGGEIIKIVIFYTGAA